MQALREWVSGLEDVVLQKLEGATVEIVCSRFRFYLNDITGRLVLRIIVIALSRECSDRVDSGIYHRDAKHGVVVVHAIKLVVRAGEFLAAGVHQGRLLRIFTRSVLERIYNGTRCKQS